MSKYRQHFHFYVNCPLDSFFSQVTNAFYQGQGLVSFLWFVHWCIILVSHVFLIILTRRLNSRWSSLWQGVEMLKTATVAIAGGRKAQLVGSQAAVWVFCAPLGDPLACRAPNKHHVCVLCRVSHGVCWDMIRRRRAGNELMLSCPWMQNYQSAFPASVGCLQRAQNWEHRLYNLWLKNNICVLFW